MLVYLAEVHQHRGRISSLSWAYKHSQAPFSYHFGFSDPNCCFHVSDTTCSPSYGLCWDLVEFQFSSLKLHTQNPFKSAQEPHRTQKVPQRSWSFYWKSLLIFPSNPIPFPPIKSLIISPLRWWLHYKGQLGLPLVTRLSAAIFCHAMWKNLNFKLFYIYFQIKACYRAENIETGIFPMCLLRDEDEN